MDDGLDKPAGVGSTSTFTGDEDVPGRRALKGRRALTLDELAEMKDRRPRLEKQSRMEDAAPEHAYMFKFSIDGYLRGEHLTGCTLGLDCIVVLAPTFEAAHRLAADGIESTVDLGLEALMLGKDEPSGLFDHMGGAQHDGRRAKEFTDLHTFPELKHDIEKVMADPEPAKPTVKPH